MKNKHKFIKHLSKCPKHLYWITANNGDFIRLEPMKNGKRAFRQFGNDLIVLHTPHKKYGETGAVVIGLNLYEGYEKITKEEYEAEIKKVSQRRKNPRKSKTSGWVPNINHNALGQNY